MRRIERLGPYPQPDGQVRLYDLDGTNELVIDPPTSGSQYGFGMHDIVISGGKLLLLILSSLILELIELVLYMFIL